LFLENKNPSIMKTIRVSSFLFFIIPYVCHSQCPQTLEIVGSSEVCNNGTVMYSTEPGMTLYRWSVPTGSEIVSGQGTNAVFVRWGNTPWPWITLTYEDDQGCRSHVLEHLGPKISGLDYVCFPNEHPLYSTEPGKTNYIWEIYNGSFISGQGTNEVSVLWAGSGYVSVTYYNGCQYVQSPEYRVTVNEVNPGTISYLSPNNGCSSIVNSTINLCPDGDPNEIGSVCWDPPSGWSWNTLSYQWFSSIDGGETYQPIDSATNEKYNPPPGIQTNTIYTRTTYSTIYKGTCSATSNKVYANVYDTNLSGGEIGSSQSICMNGDPAPFTSIIDGSGTSTRYQWQKSIDGNNFTGISGTISNTYDAPPGLNQTTYYRRIIYSLPCPSYKASSNDILVTIINPIVLTSNKTICSGQSANLSLTTDISGATYSWVVQSKTSNVSGVTVGTSGTSNPINHTLTNTSTSSGTIVYRITATANSCSGNYKDVTVTVNPKPSASISGSTSICPGIGATTLTANPGGTGYSYLWSTGATSRSINVSSAGTYTVAVTFDGCTSNNASAKVTVDNSPGYIMQDGDLCTQGQVTLYAGQGYGYSWSNGSWSNPTTVYWEGPYWVNYYSSGGCPKYAETYVYQDQSGSWPCNMARQRGSMENKDSEEIAEIVVHDLTIYPNPASEDITIHFPEPVGSTIYVSLLSVTGQQMKQAVIEEGKTKTTLYTQDVIAGFYLVQLETKNGLLARKKVMIVHQGN
jgi:hypothetical protein